MFPGFDKSMAKEMAAGEVKKDSARGTKLDQANAEFTFSDAQN